MNVHVLWAIAVGFVALSCGRSEGQDHSGVSTEDGLLEVLGEGGHYRFVLEPSVVELNEFFSVSTRVEDARSGELIAGGVLRLDATMPEHGHGMVTLPKTRHHEGGRYRTVGCKFHMHGRWVFELDFVLGGVSERATVDYAFLPASAQ